MKQRYCYLFLFRLLVGCCIFQQAVAQKSLRVLFIGNSYTASHNLPNMVKQMAASTGDTLYYAISAPGGYTFEAHTRYQQTIDLIRQGSWDAVVLQEQSQRPSLTDSVLDQHIRPYARILDSVIRVHNPCARVLLFRTWGRGQGDAQYCGWWPPVCTYEGMDSLLALRYRIIADQIRAELSPVGDVWKAIREAEPGIQLYAADQSHPSPAGTYAAAAAFYTSLFRKPAGLVSWNQNLLPVTAGRIRSMSDQVVYEHPDRWYHGKYDLKPSMQVDFLNSYTVKVRSLSREANEYFWESGMGNEFTGSEQLFIYTASGRYTIRHWVSNACGFSDTLQRDIQIYIPDRPASEPLLIYPNPATNTCTVYGAKIEKLVWMDATGRILGTQFLQGLPPYTLYIGHLPRGWYRLMMTGPSGTRVQTLIRQ